ncbi:XdhC family protein [Aureimonas populi]|uniref:XdhC family protein n=1 Tax=Aureimonas populi TaxID=1701758 RepID=A0ABW5CPL7_9HYPH|nr:XdhC family protein [Aureimonas populi]
MRAALLRELNEARAARRAVALETELSSGRQRLVRETGLEADPRGEAIASAFRSGKSASIETPDGAFFVNVHLPPPRLVVIGAVHISQALAPMARLAGYDMEIIDPRTAFASPDRFAGVPLYAAWPQDVLAARPLDAYTALAALTHDPKIDDFPLAEALRAGCFYVGALGSRKTHARRVERLGKGGLPEDAIARIEAPIGVDIGASTPAEIAVAVLGSIIAAFRKRRMRPERRGETPPR